MAGSKMGRPPKEINQEQFEKLCGLQCTQEEICSWFDITSKTLEKWCKETYGKDMTYSKVFAQKRGAGKISLRRAQFRLAEKNAAMAIWLGKQYLGQTENPNIGDTELLGAIKTLLGGVPSAID